jgi:hypothetical protein
MQDAFATWKPMDEFKLDTGMLLIPFSHNSLQSAAALYGWDYYFFSFQQSGGLTNSAGRDTGVQVRGLIAKHLDYRLGLFQGNRAAPATGPMAPPPLSRTTMRFSGRLQYNFLDAETGTFYAGTYGGTKRILSVGFGIDHQDDYTGVAGDAFVDLPIGSDVLTAQVNVDFFDGGTWISNLHKQTDVMAEAGYRFGAIQLSPIVRFENQSFSDTTTDINVLRIAGGIAWWVMNHNINVKLFYTYIKPDSDTLKKYSQINLQTQFYVF